MMVGQCLAVQTHIVAEQVARSQYLEFIFTLGSILVCKYLLSLWQFELRELRLDLVLQRLVCKYCLVLRLMLLCRNVIGSLNHKELRLLWCERDTAWYVPPILNKHLLLLELGHGLLVLSQIILHRSVGRWGSHPPLGFALIALCHSSLVLFALVEITSHVSRG
jgi:hypothetical protein